MQEKLNNWWSAIPSDRDNGIEFSRMIYSGRTEYAIRGLSELASRAGEAFVMLDDVVTGTDLPRDFLAKIFQDLVRAGILKSARDAIRRAAASDLSYQTVGK